MTNYTDDYHTRIKPEFLFDVNEVFKSNYTPWVYVHIKILKNPFFKKPRDFTFSLNVREIADLFNTNPDTIYTCIKDLEQARMIERQGTKYRLLPDTNYCTPIEGFRPYIEIYRHTFLTQLNEFKNSIPENKDNRGLLAKVIKTYYYLTDCNGHCLLDKPVVESFKTQTSLSRELRIDSRTTKRVLDVLESTGYIKYNDKNRILTIDKDLYEDKRAEICFTQPLQNEPAQTELKPKVPERFIGFFKSEDGSHINMLYYSEQNRDIMLGKYCDGDGIPATREEYEKSRDLLSYGKDSVYYDKNSYWKYQKERKAFKEKYSKEAA